MANYIYVTKNSEGVKALAETTGLTRVSAFDGLNFYQKGKRIRLGKGDNLICWGKTLPQIHEVRMLNATDNPKGPFASLYQIRHDGAYTCVIIEPAKRLDAHTAARSNPRYYGRSGDHKSGDDLLFGCSKPDWWTRYQLLPEQYRLHVFNGKLVRYGIKVPKPDHKVVKAEEWKPNAGMAHPWVMSDLGGWTINYLDVKPNSLAKSTATGAIRYLGLDFGTVDLGYDGTYYYITGINFVPDLPDDKAVEGYVKRIERWLKGGKDAEA